MCADFLGRSLLYKTLACRIWEDLQKWRPAVFEENVTVILAVYRDDKPVAFKAAQTKLTAGTKARRVQLTLDIPEGEGRLAAEYFMISSFDSRKP